MLTSEAGSCWATLCSNSFRSKVVRSLGLILATTGLWGCQTARTDRVPYSIYHFWRNAAIETESPVTGSPAIHASVIPGDEIVLLIVEGCGRGEMSTTHSSHTACFFSLPGDVSSGDSVMPSPSDGTFALDEFTGRRSAAIDGSREAHLRVEVIDVEENELIARIFVDLPTITGFGYEDRSYEETKRVSIDDTFTFKRQTIKEHGYSIRRTDKLDAR